jgi:uncharacterized protein YbaA (DUF1428 family)
MIKLPRFCLALALVAAAVVNTRAADSTARVYELRTYTAAPGKLAALQSRFRDHTLKIFERHGMVNVVYWTPLDAKDGAADKLVYLLEHKSRDAAKASWKSFSADPEWKDVSTKSQVDGKLVTKVESVFLTPTDFSRPMNSGNAGRSPRVFEMRTYTAPEGKLADLDARFRDHTIALFARHGITNLGYFHPVDADKGAAYTLVYFLAYPSREAADASWKAFRDDPNWAKAKTASEKNGKLTTKVESLYLKPTDYSPIK